MKKLPPFGIFPMPQVEMFHQRSDQVFAAVPFVLGAITFGSALSLTLNHSGNPISLGQAAQAQTQDWAAIEANIIREHNRVRQNPRSYIPMMEDLLSRMNDRGDIVGGCGPNCNILTREGKSAVREAISFLNRQNPLPSLSGSPQVARAAKSHALDQSQGAIGHTGRNGSTSRQRLQNAGVRDMRAWGENIEYGGLTAQQVVMNLIIDDGVSNRGHRTAIFGPRWTSAGAGCGSHARFRSVCVVNYIQSRRASNNTYQTSQQIENSRIETSVADPSTIVRDDENGDRSTRRNRGFFRRVSNFFNIFGF